MNKPAVNFYDFSPAEANFLSDVLEGLSRQPKTIAPKYFYDKRGSELFDAICKQPEYYPTRTEISILQNNAHDIAKHIESECVLLELGSGASEKVRLLFDALKPESYLGIDISRDFLLQATQQLAIDYEWLEVHAVCADFSHQVELPPNCDNGRLVAFYPGSSIGNFEPDGARQFLKQVASAIGKDGKMIIGIDLKKDKTILDAAYNDAAGITADFNLNLLTRMKDELAAELDESAFEHRAFYNEDAGRVEMYLVSKKTQEVRIGNQKFSFSPGEAIHTENSYKYTPSEFSAMACEAGFEVEGTWTDERDYFCVLLLTKS